MMQHRICLIPGRSDFYEVVTMRKQGSNLLVDTYNVVGPPSTSRQRQAWEQTLASQLPKGSDIKMVSVLPFPLAPVSPKMKKVDSSSADFNLGGRQEARENAALMPTLRRQGKKYGYESLPIEMADVGEHGGGGMVQAILYVIFGGRYYGGYIFRPGSPKVIRVSMLDALEKVKGRDKALLIHRLVKQMGPLAYGAKLTQVKQEIPALDDDEYEYKLEEWYEGGQMGPEPVRDSRSFQFPMMMYEGDLDDHKDMEELYALFQYAEVPNIQEAMPALLQRTVGWAEKCRDYPAGSNDQMRCAARQLMIGWGEDHKVQSMLQSLTPKERHRYAKVLLTTLSRDKALKAVFPNLKGKAKAIRSFVDDFYVARGMTARELKDMANYGPPLAALRGSDKTWWKWQTAEEAGLTPEEVIAEQRRGSIRKAIERRRKVGSHVLKAPTAVELRNLIFQKRYDSSQIDRLYDAIMMVRENMQFFPETREGVLYVNHVAEKNWPQVLKDHDGISALADTYSQRRWAAQSQAEAKHLASTRKLTKALPVLPGITPLLTNADFKREADLMKHCILSHAQRPLHHFHIEHPETGEHSTIQLQKNGHVMQHYGISDREVSPSQDAYVEQWLKLAFPKRKAKSNSRRYRPVRWNPSIGLPPRDEITEKDYPSIFGDFDGDGYLDADDPDPYGLTKKPSTMSIEEVRLADEMSSLMSARNQFVGAKRAVMEQLNRYAGPKDLVYGRVKSPYSLINKLRRSYLSRLTDVAGVTIVRPTYEDVHEAYMNILRDFEVLEDKDYYQRPKNGYRAHHLILRVMGVPVEVQVKTYRMKAIGEQSHHPYKMGMLNNEAMSQLTRLADRADKGDADSAAQFDTLMAKGPKYLQFLLTKPVRMVRKSAKANRGVSGVQWQMASKYWPAGYDGLDPEINRKIIGKWLSNAPSAWKSEFSSGMSERVATGQGGSRAMNVDNALKILGITAGGNISGDTARGRNKVPDSVRFDAMKGLALSWTHDYGGWNFIGVARAIQLAIMPGVPNETMNRMANFFGRNQKWKKARQFGDDNDPSRGYMAWLNWGGVAAEKWLAG